LARILVKGTKSIIQFDLKQILCGIERLTPHGQHGPAALVHADLRFAGLRDGLVFLCRCGAAAWLATSSSVRDVQQAEQAWVGGY
jgi:hypothetical protein